jgi:hypothetical protein
MSCDTASDSNSRNRDGCFGGRDEWDELGWLAPVFEVVRRKSIGMAVHLSFLWEINHWCVIILVSFNVMKGKWEGKTLDDVDDPAFKIKCGG